MKPSVVSLSRLEFNKFSVEINTDFSIESNDAPFPQIEYDFNNVSFELATDLVYPDEEINDPRHFTLMLSVDILQESQDKGVKIPYSVSIGAFAYLYFKGKEEGEQRFKIVRGTGYMMLYGAIRECIANFTGRSAYGVWFLPSPNFNSKVEEDVVGDLDQWNKARKALQNISQEDSISTLSSSSVQNIPKPRSGARKKISK